MINSSNPNARIPKFASEAEIDLYYASLTSKVDAIVGELLFQTEFYAPLELIAVVASWDQNEWAQTVDADLFTRFSAPTLAEQQEIVKRLALQIL